MDSEASGMIASDSPPRSRGRSRTFSQMATSMRLSPGEKTEQTIDGPRRSFSSKADPKDRAQRETRKLLMHIMLELENRPRPPSIWQTCKAGLEGQRAGTRRPEKTQGSRFIPGGDSESEDETKSSFSPQTTFALLHRLRELLIFSLKSSWFIFDVGSQEEKEGERQTAFRFRRSSFNASGSRSRSSSPNASKTNKASSGSLSRCIQVLNAIITDDCRYRITTLRADKPPNATHAIVLDVGLALINMYRGEPKVLYDIGMAFLPAFSTFPENMFDRLLTFFENGLVRGMVYSLRSAENDGLGHHNSKVMAQEQSESQGFRIPMVAIQVDEAQDESLSSDTFGWKRWLPEGASPKAYFSTNVPGQSLDIYYLASLIGPLVATILDNVDLSTQDVVLCHRLRSFFTLLSDNKQDFPLTLLEIAAFHSSRARYASLALLQSGWPGTMGHLSISKALPATVFRDRAVNIALRTYRGDAQAHIHQFAPWHFYPTPASAVFKGSAYTDCHVCSKQIDGFGLFCPFCVCAVHPNCYDAPYGTRMLQYPMVDEHRTQRVVVHRFSDVKRQGPSQNPIGFRKRGHILVLTNIFTLSLCGACLLPLWGYMEQGYRCDTCNQYVHASCLHGDAFLQMLDCRVTHDSGRITISWAQFHSSFITFYKDILFAEQEILQCTQEELSVYWSILWTQLQLLKYGIASGTIILSESPTNTKGGSRQDIEGFELHRAEALYSYFLESRRLQRNPMIMEYCQQCGYDDHFWNILNDWPTLLFIASTIKTPFRSSEEADGDLLNVAEVQKPFAIPNELYDHPAASMSLAKVRDNLAQLGLIQSSGACVMLKHLRHLGFFDCEELPLFVPPSSPREIICNFQLPLGLDLSSDVELLLVCIEACLDDLDVSINESGLLLLNRKLWPNGMASDYTLSRLVKAIVQWVLAEDDNLVIILREYVARSRYLPGVPSATDSHCWPSLPLSRTASTGSVNNGNDYVMCRKALLDKYVLRWLFALHCQDPGTYATFLFDAISGLALEATAEDNAKQTIGEESKLFAVRADRLLRSIMKVCQSSIAFSVEDDLFLKWLALIPNSMTLPTPLTNLPRLLNREVEPPARWTSAFDATINSFEHADAPLLDPWKVVTGIASKSYEGLRKTLEWIGVFAFSGVDIPSSTFTQLSSLIRESHFPFDCDVLLCRAVFMSLWVKSLGRQNLQELVMDMYERNIEYLSDNIMTCESDSQICYFIRATLSSLLLMYGCERARIRELGLIKDVDVETLIARRKVVKRASQMSEPMVEDLDLVNLLILQFMEKGPVEIRCLILKFLTCLLTRSSLLSAQELETLILNNTVLLTRCIWIFYDMQKPEINDLRSILLLRTIVVDSRAFEELLKERLASEGGIDSGLDAATKMFTIVLDVAKRSFVMEEGKQWRSCLISVFFGFFNCLWSNDHEHIRLATEAWSHSLQPIHHQSMALYFGDYLSSSPIDERLELVSFLIKLHSNFPSWKVLAWDVVIETLMDDEFMQRDNADESAIQAHMSMYGLHANADRIGAESKDPSVFKLQASLIQLGLQMIASGIFIDVFSFLKLKLQLAVLLGFSEATLVPAKNGHSFHVQLAKSVGLHPGAYSCIQSMMIVVDSDRTMDIAASAMTPSVLEDETTYSVLVGSIIVDVVLGVFHCLFEHLKDFPYIQLKALLQSLIIVVYKHDLECPALKHLREVLRGVVKRMSDLLLQDIGHECKHLAITVIQAYRKRWPGYAANREMVVYQVSNIVNLISSTSSEGDEVINSRALSLLEEMLSVNTGIFFNLSKHPMAENKFNVLRMVMARNARNYGPDATLPDQILRDTLQYIIQAQNEPDMKTILENVRNFIEFVYFQGYSSDSLAFVGESFIIILRNAGDFYSEGFDPSPIIMAAGECMSFVRASFQNTPNNCMLSSSLLKAILIQHNKAQIRAFLHHLETVVRVALGRFDVKDQPIKRVLQVTHSLYRRTADSTASAQERNIILSALLEILSDGLRGKGRISNVTMKSVVDALSIGTHTYLTSDMIYRLAADAFYFMQMSNPLESVTQNGIPALKAASMLLLYSARNDPDFLLRQMNDSGGEHRIRQGFAVRVWNVLAIEALESKIIDKPASWLFRLLSTFCARYSISLRANVHTTGLPPDMMASDVNQAFIAIKLWLILARKCAEESRDDDDSSPNGADASLPKYENHNAHLVWNELWPPFERLVGLSEVDAEIGELTPIASLVWSSVADILLFIRMMRSPVALDASSHVAVVSQLQALEKGESFSGKFSRTMNSISKPPQEVPVSSLISQAAQELQAAEKIHILESRRELGRIPDRSRRDLRQPTGSTTH